MNRVEEINKLNYCEYYKEFLRQNTEQPLPNTLYFKCYLDYMIWIKKKHSEFRKINNMPLDICFDKIRQINYNEKFLKWLSES